MPLRIAILCEYPTLNGGERSILACVDRLATDDLQFTFLAPRDGPLSEELRRRSLRHVPFDLHAGNESLGRSVAAEQLVGICSDRCDLLHANSLAMGRLTGAAAPQLPMPATAHLRDIVKLSAAAIDDLNRNAGLIAVSQAVRDFHAAQGLATERVHVIYNGIDAAAFRPRPRTGDLRRELQLPDSAFLVASIGQICLRKGQDDFAEAAVRTASSLPMAHFVLVGARHSSKPESIAFETALAARFRNAGLGDRFHPLGERHDVPQLLNEIDVLVHAARQEPFGRVLLEAAAAGVPIVATDVGGTREMLIQGVHALLVRPDDPQAIADAVVRLARQPQLAARLTAAAREHVVSQFPIERAAGELSAMWRNIVAGPTR